MSIRRRRPSLPQTPRSSASALQLVTNGIKATEYRPAGSDKAVDILVRFPEDRRSLDQMDELRVQTPSGSVPISNFVERVAAPRVGFINRVAGNRVMTVSANVAQGVQTAKVQEEIAKELATADLGTGVTWRLKGEDEERAKAGAFLMKAFGTAIFMIFAILLAQFNRLTSVGLVLSAVILSTIGVLLGLMVMGQPFGVVMTGIGVIANAGVIVNNNIVLIDTYDRLRREGWEAYDAIVETCRERARPVVLTAVTAVLGVLPIAFGVNIEFLTREISVGAPATQWWISLSTAIVFGLAFATVLTLCRYAGRSHGDRAGAPAARGLGRSFARAFRACGTIALIGHGTRASQGNDGPQAARAGFASLLFLNDSKNALSRWMGCFAVRNRERPSGCYVALWQGVPMADDTHFKNGAKKIFKQ